MSGVGPHPHPSPHTVLAFDWRAGGCCVTVLGYHGCAPGPERPAETLDAFVPPTASTSCFGCGATPPPLTPTLYPHLIAGQADAGWPFWVTTGLRRVQSVFLNHPRCLGTPYLLWRVWGHTPIPPPHTRHAFEWRAADAGWPFWVIKGHGAGRWLTPSYHAIG